MRIKNSVPRILGVCLLLMAIACHKPDPPEYCGFLNLRIGKGQGQTTILSTSVKFYNPNPFSLTLRRADMDVSINGKPVGHAVLDSTIFIPKRDTFFIPVSLQVDLHDLFSNALQMLMDRQVKIAFDGRVKLRRDGIPFNVPFHYEGEQDLNALLPQGN
jgi:LEA14-like dessication related protein